MSGVHGVVAREFVVRECILELELAETQFIINVYETILNTAMQHALHDSAISLVLVSMIIHTMKISNWFD